jgi:hypothetical protein
LQCQFSEEKNMLRKTLPVVLLVVVMLMAACGSGTPTPTADASPKETPVVEEPSIEAPKAEATGPTETPTVEGPPTETPTLEPTGTPTLEPTETLMPVCTPPACAEDEVYYCPGDCPGGCGTECATLTPGAAVSLPTIVSFTADPMEFVQGGSVTFSWEATGGTEAWIEWVNNFAILESKAVDPNGGSVVLEPPNSPVALHVRNSAGDALESIELTIVCAYAWVPALANNPPSSRCPFEAEYGAAAQQSFENGFMIWLGPSRTIYVFYDDGGASVPRQYQTFEDAFEEGDPESDPDIVPPGGLYQPVRGFGLVWRTHPEVRERLGWATAPEAGSETWRQSFSEMAMHSYLTLIQGIDGMIYYLSAMGSSWQVYEP